ncbi:MAG: replication-associated recombination protein A [Segniliparus sp.]|uniref:replication-associated recombination protein A n=1 Tax=Segniliparus sp. TaxID=2804064 RepID=UPI003F36B890
MAVVSAAHVPLAVRMRPRDVAEVLGQDHLLGPGRPLRRLVDGHGVASVVLHGPPGTGKTTIASLLSAATGREFVALSALTAGVKEVREVIEDSRMRLAAGVRTVLFIDEVHRFSKTQQDALLAAVEHQIVLLVAATTENPGFAVVSPLLSRSLVLELRPLAREDLDVLIGRALADERGYGGRVGLADDAREHLLRVSGGDARRLLTALEAAVDLAQAQAPESSGETAWEVSLEQVTASLDEAMVRYDRDGDQHYDVVSAFIKSIRGSDVDAALHYLARMVIAGEDPRFIARRLMIHASEDVGMADPTALSVATAAAQAVAIVGLPEARIILAQATIHLATAPKSNAVIQAIGAAEADVRAGRAGPVPQHLRDGHSSYARKTKKTAGYRYPHDTADGVLAQQYPPDELVGVDYYQPTNHGFERELSGRVPKLRNIVRGGPKTRRPPAPDNDTDPPGGGKG